MRYPCTMDPGWIVAVIFWPDRLTDEMNWDEGDPNERIDRLKREGRMIELCEGRGNYEVLLCFDEPIPSEIEPYIQQRTSLPTIEIQGRTLFGPVALLATDGLGEPSRFETLDLPEGSFAAELVRAKVPRRRRLQSIRQRAGTAPYWAYTLAWWIYWIEVVLFFPTLMSWMWWGWPGAIAMSAAVVLLALLGSVLYWSDAYRQALAARERFDQEHPAIILRMTSTGV